MLRPERGFGSRERFSLAVGQQSIWWRRACPRELARLMRRAGGLWDPGPQVVRAPLQGSALADPDHHAIGPRAGRRARRRLDLAAAPRYLSRMDKPLTNRERAARHRARLKDKGLRRMQIWVLSCSPFQAAGAEIPGLSFKLFSVAAAGQGRGHDHETTVDHALMRGLVTAGPVIRRGASSV